MKSRFLPLMLLILIGAGCNVEERDPATERSMFITPFEADTLRNTTATYDEVIDFYYRLSLRYRAMRLLEIGETDSGKPLHAVVISRDGIFEPDTAHNRGYRVIMINNGIHPGEPCGIDASMAFARELLIEPANHTFLNQTIVVIIPVYNVGGALQRNSTTRVNQIGPESYGFRGNANNLDLNRDFMKSDSKNARAFHRLFSRWRPHIFIDTHTTNGADYQHVMTLLATQHEKLPLPLRNLLNRNLKPFLYQTMEEAGYPMCPYVYTRGIPDHGIAGFNDLPRFSTGYAALFNSLGFMTEAHMLKPYHQRVEATGAFLWAVMEYNRNNGAALLQSYARAGEYLMEADSFPLRFSLDRSQVDSVFFLGYEAGYSISRITGQPRLYYDINRPYSRNIPFYNHYIVEHEVSIPEAYIIPRAWTEIVDRLADNHVEMYTLDSSRTMLLEYYRIHDVSTLGTPFEGRFLHTSVSLESFTDSLEVQAGWWYIPARQRRLPFIMHALEPEAPDSYFAWGYFNSILQRKEFFSAYLFEDIAPDILEDDPDLKAAFRQKQAEDLDFAGNVMAQLRYIYERSEFSEPGYRRYPVYRVPAQEQTRD